jgi:hypothetical protein
LRHEEALKHRCSQAEGWHCGARGGSEPKRRHDRVGVRSPRLILGSWDAPAGPRARWIHLATMPAP